MHLILDTTRIYSTYTIVYFLIPRSFHVLSYFSVFWRVRLLALLYGGNMCF